MTCHVGEHRRFGGKVLAVAVAVLIVCGLGLAPPTAADIDQCTPPGIDGAIASPTKLATANHPHEDKYTIADVEPLTSVDISALGLKTPGTLTVATLSRNPPTACINCAGGSPVSTTNCYEPSPTSWVCESTSSASSSPRCWPRWHGGTSTSPQFPDYITAYASLKTRQVDAWVVGTMEAQNAVHPGDPAAIVEHSFGRGDFVAYAVAKENRALMAALNSGLDAVIAEGTWS